MSVETIVRDGAEVRVETGVGVIKQVEPKGDRNAQVTIFADHLKLPVKAWVDRQGPVWPRIEHASSSGMKVAYRIEVHRKRNVDASIPLAEVGNYDKVRDLVAIDRPEDAPAPAQRPAAAPAPAAAAAAAPAARAESLPACLRQLAQTRKSGEPAEQIEFLVTMARDLGATAEEIEATLTRQVQRTRGPVPAEQDQWASPPPATNGHQVGGGVAVATRHLAEARDPDAVGERAPTPAPMTEPAANGNGHSPAVSPVSGLTRRTAVGIASDSRPWEYFNSDGRVNLSSYAAGAVSDFVNLAGRLLITRARQLHAEDQTRELAAPTRDQVQALASNLLHVANAVQHRMRDGGRVDLMASSHRLARQAVREGLDLYPVPWNADEATRKAWKQALADHALILVASTIELLEPGSTAGGI